MQRREPKPGLPVAPKDTRQLDTESRVILYEGCSVTHLARLFGREPATVTRLISQVEPCGMRTGFPIYAIKDVAPYLVKPVGDFEAYIRKMNHRDLPPQLSKEFWTAQRYKQQFEEEAGDLWRTEAVVRHFAEAAKTLRVSLLLMKDAVERQTELTARQREIIDGIVDATLTEMREMLELQFADFTDGDEETGRDGGGGGVDPEVAAFDAEEDEFGGL